MTKKNKILTLFFAFVSLWLGAQNPRVSPPESVGINPLGLARIDTYLEDLIKTKKISGAVALIARKGKVAHFKSYGWADIADNRKMDNEAIFRIKSMTKPITSVAAMMLVEEGKLRLDDPLSKFIPEFKNTKVGINTIDSLTRRPTVKNVALNREITVRDLLTHSSGLIMGWLYPGILGEIWKTKDNLEYTNIGDLSRGLATLPLAFQPGAAWAYGRSSDVLGYVIEVASGMTLDKFFQEKIFAPLEMSDTYFELPNEKLPRLVSAYAFEYNNLRKIKSATDMLTKGLPPSAFYNGGKRTLFTGGEGLVSTATDYFRFASMLLNQGEYNGKRLLSRKTIELMTTSHISNIPSPLLQGYDFGLGFGIHTSPAKSLIPGSVGEYFWNGAFNTVFWADPKEELIGILMLQIDPYGHLGIVRQFKSMTYMAIGD
ncbi:MAG: beta-lactamase family protein [Microscillaceae bacterium]|nr:beta-lactamase family protein [Microscillaceae bacterium]